MTGVDFSPVALAKAQDLACGCGVEAQFIEADVTGLPSALRDRHESM